MKIFKSRIFKISIISVLVLFLLIIFAFFAGWDADPYRGRRPVDQKGSTWYCKEYDIRFIVDPEDLIVGYIRNRTDQIPFSIIWSAFDSSAMFVQNYRETEQDIDYDFLFDGVCKFSANKFVFQILNDDTDIFDAETPPTLEFSKIDTNVSFHDFLGKSYVWNAEKTLKSVKEKFLAFQPEMNDIALAISKRDPSISLHFDQGVLTTSDGKSDCLPQGIDEQLKICKPLLKEFDSVHLAFGKSLEDGKLMFSKTLIEIQKVTTRYVFVILIYSPQIPDTGEEICDGWYITIYSAV